MITQVITGAVAFFWLCIIFISAGLLGRKILRRSEDIFLFYSVFLGIGIITTIVYMLGLFSLLYKSLSIIIIFSIIILAKKEIAPFYKDIKAFKWKWKWKKTYEKIILITLCIFFMFNTIITFLPATEWDAITYHLPLANIYANEHSIKTIPWLLHSNFPQFGEVLLSLGFIIQGETLAKMLLWICNNALFLYLYYFIRKYWNNRIALITVAIIYTLPEVSIYITQVYVDILTAFYEFLAISTFFIFLFDKKEKNNTMLAMLSFAFAGISAQIKYTALITVIICFCILLYHIIINKPKKIILISLTCIFIAALFCVPTYVKNYYYSDDPVFPFLYKVFPNEHWSQDIENFWENDMDIGGLRLKVDTFLELPFEITFNQIKFGSIYGITPLFLIILPLGIIFLRRKNQDKILFILFIIFTYGTFWVLTEMTFRLVFISIFLLALLCSIIIERINYEYIKNILIVVVMIVLISNIILYFLIYRFYFPVIFLTESKEYVLEKEVQNYGVQKYISEKLSEEDIILYVNDLRTWYSNKKYIWGEPVMQNYIDYANLNSPEELYKRLKQLGITHIIVTQENESNNSFPFYKDEKRRKMTRYYKEIFEEYSVLVYKNNNVYLYKIK